MNIGRTIRAAVGSGQSPSMNGADVAATAGKNGWRWLLFVGLVTALLCMPFSRAIFWLGDEGVLLHGADRMLRGSRLYADLFEFLPPGGFAITAVWFGMAGVSLLSARILIILTIVGIACFTYLACRQASKNAPLSAFLVIGWVAMSQGTWTQVSHHWFTTLFAMVAAWAALASLEQRALRWPFIAGVAVGMAGMITPTRGALAVLAALTAFLVIRRNRAGSITYVLAVALVPAGFIAYLGASNTLGAAFDDVILFTATRYAPIQGLPFGSFAAPQNLPLKYLFPVAALLMLLVAARDWRAILCDHPLQLCAAFGLAGFIGCFPRADISHIAFAAPLAYPLFTLCVSRLTSNLRPVLVWILAALTMMLHVPAIIYLSTIGQGAIDSEVTPTPRGNVKFVVLAEPRESILSRIAATPPDDGYFFYPYLPMLPFLTGREHVAKYDIFQPWHTLPSHYHDACLSVMRQASWLVLDHTWMGPGVWKEFYPTMPDVQPQETTDFEEALDRGFEFVARDGNFELRRRREDASDALCAELAN